RLVGSATRFTFSGGIVVGSARIATATSWPFCTRLLLNSRSQSTDATASDGPGLSLFVRSLASRTEKTAFAPTSSGTTQCAAVSTTVGATIVAVHRLEPV